MRRPRICFYVSDFGYGHAARAIALTRELQDAISAEVTIRTGSPAEFMARSLPGVEVRRGQNDPGVVMVEGLPSRGRKHVQRSSAGLLPGMTTSPPRDLSSKTIRSTLSSLTSPPQPFLAAEELGIPSFGISNFTWHLIYTHLLGKTEETDRIAEAYRAADGALLLPLHEPMEVFSSRREVGLVARRVTRDRENLRGLPGARPLVYLRPPEAAAIRGCACLVPSWTEIPGTISIPPDETETQDWIAACDLVVSSPATAASQKRSGPASPWPSSAGRVLPRTTTSSAGLKGWGSERRFRRQPFLTVRGWTISTA